MLGKDRYPSEIGSTAVWNPKHEYGYKTATHTFVMQFITVGENLWYVG